MQSVGRPGMHNKHIFESFVVQLLISNASLTRSSCWPTYTEMGGSTPQLSLVSTAAHRVVGSCNSVLITTLTQSRQRSTRETILTNAAMVIILKANMEFAL